VFSFLLAGDMATDRQNSKEDSRTIHVDTTRVGLNALRIDGGGHRSSGEDLGHDLVVSMCGAEFRDTDGRVGLDSRAAHIRVVVAIHAVVDVRALHVLGLVLLQVTQTRKIGNRCDKKQAACTMHALETHPAHERERGAVNERRVVY
jgi:hypothetical protein